MLLSDWQMSGHTGAKLLHTKLPPVDILIAERGCDRENFRAALAARKIKASIPPKMNRRVPYSLDKKRCRNRHKIEKMFGTLKDRQPISTRFDLCAHTFFSAI